MTRSDIQRNLAGFGLFKTLQDIAFRALNRFVLVRIFHGLRICQASPKFARCTQNYRGGFLDAPTLMQFCDSQNELREDFLRDALRHGDECYGFLDGGGSLVSYGWYSKRPTPIEPPQLTLHVDPPYIYMYKSFTRANHRGQRLHAAGVTRALKAYLAQGYKGLVSYVEWNNFGALKSCYRMGYAYFGSILVTRILGRFFIWSTPGCKPYGFRLEPRKPEVLRERGAAAGHSAHV